MQERKRRGANRLTPREVEVLRAVVEGQDQPEIGFSLGISDKTVEKHLEDLRQTGSELARGGEPSARCAKDWWIDPFSR
jgi:FixJ family two-component response regulator